MTYTIKSNTTIVYPKGLERYKNGFDILYNQFSFKKDITYRRYVFGEDNLSGDKDYATYYDYNITAELQFEGETRDIGMSGYVISNFGNIYLPSIISEDKDGNGIASFRPQLKDEFYYDGNWYMIQNITPTQFANTPIGMECLFKLIGNEENPR